MDLGQDLGYIDAFFIDCAWLDRFLNTCHHASKQYNIQIQYSQSEVKEGLTGLKNNECGTYPLQVTGFEYICSKVDAHQ